MSRTPPARWPAALLVFLLALVLQLPLILNPGYFSHDELQWADFAATGTPAGWLAIGHFQYRPLTFSVWMALSRALFATPLLLHGVLVLWGALNALLLCLAGRGFGMARWPAVLGVLAFVLTPYAAYTHGWVGCMADLIWLSGALSLAVLVQRTRSAWAAAMIAGVCTALALLGKEAAVVIPPLLLLAWGFDGRKRIWLAAMLASGAVVAVYLGLRLDVLLHAPREGAQYSLSLLHVPQRWLEYQVFPPIPPVLEASTTLRRSGPVWVAGLLWLGVLAALVQAAPRLAWVFLLGGLAVLLPVLPLSSSWNHYAYGYAAITSMAVAAAWPQASRAGRGVMVLFAILTALHGGLVMLKMQQVGRIQSVFSPALANVLRTHPGSVRLQLASGAKAWVFVRLTHNIPHYNGVDIGNRVQLVDAGQTADYRITADGQLQPLH
jgi:hypothetical protein